LSWRWAWLLHNRLVAIVGSLNVLHFEDDIDRRIKNMNAKELKDRENKDQSGRVELEREQDAWACFDGI